MNGITLALIIILCIIGAIIIYKVLKPYFIHYDSTLCVTGGLGSGKSLTCVKIAIVLVRKQRIKVWFKNLKIKLLNKCKKIINYFHRKHNLKHHKNRKCKIKKIYDIKPLLKKPMLYSNLPIHFRKRLLSFPWTEREWSAKLEAPNLVCLKKITEYSVVFIDELPQFINQFNWNEQLIQKNVNEFITYFRHYVGGYLIVNAQAIDDVVVQIRRKLNQATWCFDFRKYGWPIPLFYTIRMCDMVLSDQVQTMSTTYIEENTKLHFGLFPPRKTYDTRCYSERYKNCLVDDEKIERHTKLKTNQVLRLMKYTSDLDDTTTKDQKEEDWRKGEQIWKN